jgi:hypothetical protein
MNLQLLIDGYVLEQQSLRANSQMTLGKLVDKLSNLPPDMMVNGFESPHSYRGYYHDLAFEPLDETITVERALEIARSCMGEIFEGYKGGEYQMGRKTPIWIALHGRSGLKIKELREDGSFELGNFGED